MKNQTKIKSLFLIVFLFIFLFVFSYKKLLGLASSLDVSLEVTGAPEVTVRWAVPELRAGAIETNDDTVFFLTFRNPFTHAVSYTSELYETANDGTYMTPILLGPYVGVGSYDIGFKGRAHLTKILRGVNLASGINNLNFTQSDNSLSKGTIKLTAGDINGDGLSPSTMGDDVINSVDLSAMISSLDDDDPTGDSIRANLNQDSVVNSVDLSLMAANLDKEGER